MAKSLKTRLDQAYAVLIQPHGCHHCGLPEDTVCEIFVCCHDDPEDQEYVSDRKDARRCPACNKSDVIVLWDALRPEGETSEDQMPGQSGEESMDS